MKSGGEENTASSTNGMKADENISRCMDRKQFLKAAAAAVAAAPLLGILNACASPAPIVYARTTNDKALLPSSILGELSVAGRYIKVYIAGHANPIFLFQGEGGELTALLSTCSHSGCEVKKLRTKFECPCHGSEYDLHGNVLRGPAPEPLQAFRVVRREAFIEILLRG
jgi:nitrite reductase/ring-hydroxylating ferredoxin subunit